MSFSDFSFGCPISLKASAIAACASSRELACEKAIELSFCLLFHCQLHSVARWLDTKHRFRFDQNMAMARFAKRRLLILSAYPALRSRKFIYYQPHTP